MFKVHRWVMSLVSVSFALFHAVVGAVSWDKYDDVALLWVSIAIYLLTVSITVFLKPGLDMGPGLGAVSVIGAVATAEIANLGIGEGQTGTYASWYVGGMGVLLGIAAVRGQTFPAWVGAALITTIVVQAAGFAGIGSAGVVGMLVLIAAGQATARALRRADREIAELVNRERDSQVAITSASASAKERRERLRYVFDRALPALSFISSGRGKLTRDQKEKAMLLEANLRDEIRGRHLVNEEVREAVTAARARGVEVLLLDEGGLDSLDTTKRQRVLEQVASAISSVQVGKVTVRSPLGERHVVTVVATRPGAKAPDLWLKF